MAEKPEHTCVQSLQDNYTFYVCGKNASLFENGKWYCRRHAPSLVTAKRAARQATYDAKRAAEQAAGTAKQRQQAENARKLAAFDELLAAAERAADALERVILVQFRSVSIIKQVCRLQMNDLRDAAKKAREA